MYYVKMRDAERETERREVRKSSKIRCIEESSRLIEPRGKIVEDSGPVSRRSLAERDSGAAFAGALGSP